MSTIAFLGTGTMGLPMARNLAQAGFKVRAWNRSRERAEPLAEHGVSICQSPAEAAREAAVMVTMLSGPEAVLEVAPAALRALPPKAVWIQMSTIGIEATDRCASLAEDAGVEFLDAPVLGTREPAERGRLIVLASGTDKTVACCGPIFDAIGHRTVRAGDAGNGTRLKLVTNAWLLGLTGILAESIDLANGLGVDPGLFLDAIADGPVDSPYAHIKGAKMISGDYSEVSFRLDLARKDATLVQVAAERGAVAAPLLAEVLDRIDGAWVAGHGEEDMSALAAARRTTGWDEQPATTEVPMDYAERKREEQRPLEEAGEGESEGFELSEQELIEHAAHGDLHAAGHVFADLPVPEEDYGEQGGEADHERTSENRD